MFTILFTAVGRRVELIKAFRASFAQQNIPLRIIGVDTNPAMAAASYFVDEMFCVPKARENGYVERLYSLCNTQGVNALIPLYEPEFSLLDEQRHRFQEIGTFLLLSDRRVLEVCNDKYITYEFLQECGINTPQTYLGSQSAAGQEFPLFVKPRVGMGSAGAQKVVSGEQLQHALRYQESMLIQEHIDGVEYTVDVLADFSGNVLAAVPRVRLEVRGGEVSKSKTVDHPTLLAQVACIVKKLGAIGPLTLQCIENSHGIYWIEINPRFGGGVPLAIRSGVDYPYTLYRLIQGERVLPFVGEYKRDLVMLRYDEAVYVEIKEAE